MCSYQARSLPDYLPRMLRTEMAAAPPPPCRQVFVRVRGLPSSKLRPVLLLIAALIAALAPRARSDPLTPQLVAPGVYVFPGDLAAPSAANLGVIANAGVIVGSGGMVVIGTGTSDAHGERLLQSIAALGDKPVLLALNLYAAPEHVLGNTAFARRGIPILAHRETDRYMAQNCDVCIRNLGAAIGADKLAGSRLARPDRLIDGATTLTVGGRTLDILYVGPAQQPGGIAVLDRESGVLFAGALATLDVIPDAHDADIDGWLAMLDAMRRTEPRVLVPGRGPVAPPQRLADVADYLTALRAQAQRAYRGGTGLGELGRSPPLPRFERWLQYDTLHARNLHHQYLKLEAADLAH